MNDICFELNYMSNIERDSNSAESEVGNCIAGFAKVSQRMESELSSFSGEGMKIAREIHAHILEIRDLTREVDSKASRAESRRQKEIQPPQRPSIPSNATPEQRNAVMSAYNNKVSQIQAKNAEIRKHNERIDAYIKKCNESKNQLEGMVSKLHEIEALLKGEIERVVSRVHEFMGVARGTMNYNARVNSAMQEFTRAFRDTYEAAEKLYLMEPSSIHGYSYVDKQFEIKNTHSHILGSSGPSFVFSSGDSIPTRKAEKKEKPRDEELLIKDRNEDDFFANAQGADKIKMPSANLHKLGGKKFIAKMNGMGYTLVTGEDGSTIDSSGMLHWEK